MMRIRSNRQRSIAFDALEGRLALSTGMGAAAASHHVATADTSQTPKTIPASFKGHSQILNGTELVTTGLKGIIGKDHFTGSGTGTVAGTLFQGGDSSLSNSKGSIELGLDPAVVVMQGKHSRQEVSVVVTAASGKYASYVGMTGLLNTWNTPTKPNSTASFSGYFNT
jgi:hypothetical protein